MVRIIAFLILMVGGVFIASNAPASNRWMILTLVMVGGFSVLFYKHRRIILRFGGLTWTKEELVRHVLITGDTGSGKTTSGLQPILHQVSQHIPDWGGLVLGAKGDEHQFITELAHTYGRQHDLIHLQVRPSDASTKWKPPHRYNLVSDRSLPWTTHAKAIVDIAASMNEGRQHPFFRPMAQRAIANAFEFLEELGESVTLENAHSLLTSKQIKEDKIKKMRRLPSTERRETLIDFMEVTFTKAKAHEQTEAIIATIDTYIGFFLDPDIAAVFCSDEPNSFSFSELDRGAIITVTMPQRFVTERRYLQTYLKILFYYHALRRFDEAPKAQGNRNTLFLIADEFQNLITSTDDGISDHNVIDRIRAAGVGIIAAMQSEISADPVINERKRKVLTLNMRTRFVFRAAELEGATASADHLGKNDIWKSTKMIRPFKPTTFSKRKEQEHLIKPAKLMNLPDHTAVIVHPSKRYTRQRIRPINGKGRVYRWF